MEYIMKSNLNELNFVSRFLDKIRRGVVDSQMKKLIRKDPELAKRTKAYNKANKEYEEWLTSFLKKYG